MKIRPNALVIIQKDDYVLAEKGEDKNKKEFFYRLIGGGIEFGESSVEAIRREIKEELGASIINEEFLCSIENIFEYEAQKGHEITFLYKGDLVEELLYNQKDVKIIDKDNSYAQWIPVAEIKNGNIILYPKEAIKYL